MMWEKIIEQLKGLAANRSIKILYACESGSRAWGFPSTDSDFDVRFIYRYELDDYLSLSLPADTIELPVNELLDIGGWELRKSLQLFLKSNAPLYEWLQSPIVYYEEKKFAESLLTLKEHYFSSRAAAHHYISMASNAWSIESVSDSVRLKKYFYILRPLLAAMWITNNRTCPPMQLDLLRNQIADDDWQNELNRLLILKKDVTEKEIVSRSKILDDWIVKTFDYCHDKIREIQPFYPDRQLLDRFFRRQLGYDIRETDSRA